MHSANVEILPPAIQALVEQYARQPHIRLIMTIGSTASGKADRNSDIDIIIVSDDAGIPRQADRLRTIDQLPGRTIVMTTGMRMWVFGTSDVFSVDGQEVCTQFFTAAAMKKKVDRIIQGCYDQIGIQHPLASLASLLAPAVHVDKDGLYQEIRQKIDPYPEKLQKTIIDKELGVFLPYYLGRLESARARNDMPFAHKMVQQAIDSAIYIVFAQHKRFPNGPKRLFSQIDEMTDTTGEQLKQYLNHLYAPDTTLAAKQDTLHKLHASLLTQNTEA